MALFRQPDVAREVAERREMADVADEPMGNKNKKDDFSSMIQSYASGAMRGFGVYIPYICVGSPGKELTADGKRAVVAQKPND